MGRISDFSTKERRGTGLGLLITQKIAQEHGGTVTVQSQHGEGSTFTIRLPYRAVAPGGGIAEESDESQSKVE
jgi:signal transduction histidine kinase